MKHEEVLKKNLAYTEEQVKELQKLCKFHEKELESLNDKISDLKMINRDLQSNEALTQRDYKFVKKQREEQQEENKKLNKTIKTKTTTITEKNKEIQKLKDTIDILKGE